MRTDICITETTVIPGEMHYHAHEYHRHHGDTQVHAVRIYRVCRDPQEVICSEWLLTRFRTAAGTMASAIHMICTGGKEKYLSEYFSCKRKEEKKMVAEWEAFVKEESNECG